jgi:hypothetical protein
MELFLATIIVSARNALDGVPFQAEDGLTQGEPIMLHDTGTIRELSSSELDQVAGGLSVGLGLEIDASAELAAVSGTIDQIGGLVSGLLGGVLGAV